MSDNNENQERAQEGENTEQATSKQHTNKLENTDSIPSAGGKQLGEDHKGESKMLSDNARSESTTATGDADDLQRRLEGKKVEERAQGGEGEEKQGVVQKAKEKLGLGSKD